MENHVRAAVAAAAIAHASGRKVSSVYGPHGWVRVDASASGDRIDGYDYDRSCHISGTLPSLYHYGESSHLQLQAKGDGKYTGYDYGVSTHFEITVSDRRASLYVYSGGGWSNYSA